MNKNIFLILFIFLVVCYCWAFFCFGKIDVKTGMACLITHEIPHGYENISDSQVDVPEISSKSYLVADLDSGFVFAEKDIEKQLPIASLTKLMTAIIIAENVDLSESVLITEQMLEAYGSTNFLEKGKSFRAGELFYPVLIESSNDAAEAMTGFLGREKTIRLMNEKARDVLMKNTKFVGPSGYDPANISTAKDLFYLAKYIFINHFPFLQITKGQRIPAFGEVSFDTNALWNKNIFVPDATFIGGKTGFIKSSKYTAIFIFRLTRLDNVERNIIIILLGSQDEARDTQRIYQWLQKTYFQASEQIK